MDEIKNKIIRENIRFSLKWYRRVEKTVEAHKRIQKKTIHQVIKRYWI